MAEVIRMRLASQLLFAILLSCLSFQAGAIEAGEIATPSISAPNMDMPNPIISSPSMNTPDPKPKSQVNSDSNPNQTGSLGSNQTQVTEAKSNDVSGKWSIKFDDRPDRSLDLTLWSSGKAKIMGYGTLTKGGAGNSVTVSGSFAEEELILTVKSAESEYASQKYDEYLLDLFMVNNTSNNSMLGTYTLRSGGEFLGDGNATALKR
jgi:hypothetical protein